MNLRLGICIAALLASGSALAEKPVNIAFLPGQVGIPFYSTMQCGAQKAAKEFNVALSWNGPPDWDIALQQPFIDAALQLHPAAVVLAPTDGNALITQVAELEKQGTPVITVDAPLNKPVETQSIQSNHYLGGVAAAKAMAEVAGVSGTFLAVGMRPGLPDIDARVKGFTDTFKKEYPQAKLLPVIYPETSSTKAAQQVAAALQANPDLKGVYVTHSAAATGASSAIMEAGKRGTVKLISFDGDPQEIRDLKDGIYDALIIQQPYQMGYQSVKLAAELARKQINKAQVPHDNLLPFVIATQKNINDPAVRQYFYQTSCKS
ncbi:substrate-binding domain-containing protein [Sodalis ligni]|jgi:ribose transport system substrate-binding protein|uniref:ABC transporter substrate-binding protein n=1 Tax=Sodalis TaxID=84565 RepID=UPI00193FDBD2|nr:ABC transporter substrate-binding protein [Sodalis ligni]QWA13379.1 substrate-binding domain-containing protein [Sodalis ligni]